MPKFPPVVNGDVKYRVDTRFIPPPVGAFYVLSALAYDDVIPCVRVVDQGEG